MTSTRFGMGCGHEFMKDSALASAFRKVALRAQGGALEGQPLSPHIHEDVVTFRYYDAKAKRVAVVGDWNGWKPHPHRLREQDKGVWHLTMPRPKQGVYSYKFLVEREAHTHWVGDPENLARVEDGSGGFYSLLEIRD